MAGTGLLASTSWSPPQVTTDVAQSRASSHWAVRNIAGASALWCCTFELLHTFNYECTADFESPEDFFFRGQNILWGISRDLLFSGQLRGQKGSAPLKNPKKCPIFCFATDKKNNLLDVQNQRYIGIFASLRQRESKSEREGERGRAREREQEKERERE
jgi:hypothetical protein